MANFGDIGSGLTIAANESVQRSNDDASFEAVPSQLTWWLMQTADRSLTADTNPQKMFDTTTNGTITLPTGVYKFELFVYITGMSATSGNATYDILGAGTATTDRWGWQTYGMDNNTPIASGTKTGSGGVSNTNSGTGIVTAGTGTGLLTTSTGMFRVSTAGTVIPTLSLTTGNAATLKAGSYAQFTRVGSSSVTSYGPWS